MNFSDKDNGKYQMRFLVEPFFRDFVKTKDIQENWFHQKSRLVLSVSNQAGVPTTPSLVTSTYHFFLDALLVRGPKNPSTWVGRFAKIGFANGGANARIVLQYYTDDCELVRICELRLGSDGAGSGSQVA